eukprot:2465813-Amphidinium_carterae.1
MSSKPLAVSRLEAKLFRGYDMRDLPRLWSAVLMCLASHPGWPCKYLQFSTCANLSFLRSHDVKRAFTRERTRSFSHEQVVEHVVEAPCRRLSMLFGWHASSSPLGQLGL